MDRYEKSAEQIMKRGDMIIAEQKRRTAFIKRTAYTVSGLCAVALIGTGIWHNRDLFSAPDRKPHDDFSVITETTETTAEKSVCETTSFSITTTKAGTKSTAKATETTAKTTTATITFVNSTAQTTQTTAVSSAVQSTAVNTSETVTTAVHTGDLGVSSTIAVTFPALDSYINTHTQTSIYKTSSTTKSTVTTTVTTNIQYGTNFQYNGTTYTYENCLTNEKSVEEYDEYNGIKIYVVKNCSPEIQIVLNSYNNYYIFFNKNYSADNLKKYILDTGINKSEEYTIEYKDNEYNGFIYEKAIKDCIFSDSEKYDFSEKPTSMNYSDYATVYFDNGFTLVIYSNGYVKSENFYNYMFFNIGEEKALSFFEYLNKN